MNSESEPEINHFSHPHPLKLTDHQNRSQEILCSGCKLKATGKIYTCKPCNYFLHISCSQIPHQITHPFDHQNHILSLLPKPIYPQGLFNCDACGKQGNGFSYHCKTCTIDLHINCASMPSFLIHQSHNHQLNLIYSPPYDNKIFSCDICNELGSNHWLYRCNLCEFDAHLGCCSNNTKGSSGVVPILQAPIQQNSSSRSVSTVAMKSPVNIGGAQFPTGPPLNNYSPPPQPPQPPPPAVHNYGNYARPFVHGHVNPIRGNVWNNSLTGRAVQGLVGGASQSLSHILVNGLLGGVVGGGDSGSDSWGGHSRQHVYRHSDGGENGGNYNYGGGDDGGDGGYYDYGGSDGGYF